MTAGLIGALAGLVLGALGAWLGLRFAQRGGTARGADDSRPPGEESARRRRTEQALSEAQGRVGAMLEAIPDGVITFDDRGLIESCNPAAQAIFGCGAVRLLGQPVADLLPDIDDLRLAPPEGAGQEAVRRRLIDAQRLDGSTFPLEVSWRQLRHKGRRLHLCVLRDLGEQQRVERMKRDFVSVVSHELRTPLTSIRGALALLSDGSGEPLPEASHRLVLMAARNCERLVDLVNDILDLDRMQAGLLVIEPDVHDIVRLLRDSLRTTLGFARLYKVPLMMPRHDGPVWVSVDSRRMAQVMGNLLSNAIKFSPAGREVMVMLRPGGPECTIEVIDHGPGIPAEFRDRLFEPFAQADATDTRARGGSGLGLSITRSLVERMGGRLAFACPPGGGTVFSVTLPTVPAPPPDSRFVPTGLDDLHI